MPPKEVTDFMTTALTVNHRDLILAGPIGSLDAYVQAVNVIPVLSREDEQELARQFRENDDLDAARRLVMSQLRFVVHIARGYNGYGLPLNDLVQEGNIGLMKAVKRFDPDVGVRLVSFAIHWIRAEIHEYVLKNWRLVKIARNSSAGCHRPKPKRLPTTWASAHGKSPRWKNGSPVRTWHSIRHPRMTRKGPTPRLITSRAIHPTRRN